MAQVIKLTDNSNNTLLPISDSSYIQFSYAGGIKSVKQALDDLNIYTGEIVGGMYRTSLENGNIDTTTGTWGMFPTFTGQVFGVSEKLTISVQIWSTADNFSITNTFGNTTRTLSTTTGYISDVYDVTTTSSNTTWSGTVSGIVSSNTTILVTFLKNRNRSGTIAYHAIPKTLGITALTNNYEHLDNRPTNLYTPDNISSVIEYTGTNNNFVTLNSSYGQAISDLDSECNDIENSILPCMVVEFTCSSGGITCNKTYQQIHDRLFSSLSNSTMTTKPVIIGVIGTNNTNNNYNNTALDKYSPCVLTCLYTEEDSLNIFHFVSPTVDNTIIDIQLSSNNFVTLQERGHIVFGSCSTAKTTSPKEVVTINEDFTLASGSIIAATFTHGISGSCSITVDGSDAKPLSWGAGNLSPATIMPGETALLLYDGTYFKILSVNNIYKTSAFVFDRGSAYLTGWDFDNSPDERGSLAYAPGVYFENGSILNANTFRANTLESVNITENSQSLATRYGLRYRRVTSTTISSMVPGYVYCVTSSGNTWASITALTISAIATTGGFTAMTTSGDKPGENGNVPVYCACFLAGANMSIALPSSVKWGTDNGAMPLINSGDFCELIIMNKIATLNKARF